MDNIGKEIQKTFQARNWQERFTHLMENVLQDEDVQAFLNEHQEYFTDTDIQKSYAKLYEFVQEKSKFKERPSSSIAPGYEPKLVVSHHSIDVAYQPTSELQAKQKAQEIRQRVQAMSMPKDVREATFQELENDSERALAIEALFDFIDAYLAKPTAYHQGLYLEGSFGVGKSFLLGALANQLAQEGFSSTLVHFPSFVVEMKQSIATDTTADKLNTVKKAPILMIDDIGADSMSSWVRDDLLGVILQYRMQEQLPTFFSSNFSMQQLENEHLRYSQRGEDEPLKAKRLMERIRYLAREITVVGKNRRQK